MTTSNTLYEVRMCPVIDPPWTRIEPIRIGYIPSGLGEPSFYVTVAKDADEVARIDAYPEYNSTFVAAIGWRHLVAVGFFDAAYPIDPVAPVPVVCKVPYEMYFQAFFPLPDHLLVVTGVGMACLNPRCELVWARNDMAIDGVLVQRVEDGVIIGEAEWDPPGDWRPFRVRLADGTHAC